MKNSKLTPDPIRDAPKESKGEFQAPGAHMVLPSRAYGDLRFNRFPMTFRVLALCCAHANSFTGVFFPNQQYLAQVMQSSQQAVSQHMRKLVEYGYIEKILKEDRRRPYGKRGAKWRVIFDPRCSLEDAIAKAPATQRDEELEKDIARETLEKMNQKDIPKVIHKKDKTKETKKRTEFTQGATCKTNKSYPQVISSHKPHLVQENKPQLVPNEYINITSSSLKKIDVKRMCNAYDMIVQKYYRKAWSYDPIQLEYAKELLSLYTLEEFQKEAEELVAWKRKNNQQPPYSLKYFIQRKYKSSKGKADINRAIQGIIDKL